MSRHGILRRMIGLLGVLGVSVLLAAACGDDSSDDSADDDTTAPAAGDDSSDDGGEANACPEDGCTITVTGTEADGDEIAVTWDTNFAPDVGRNHIHIYWDTYTADQVSSDAEDRGVEQGDWVPTADMPTYTTADAVSVSVRGDSTTLCVTAADRDHVVLDAAVVDCVDVGDLL